MAGIPPMRSTNPACGFTAAIPLALLVLFSSGCAQLRNSARGFFSFGPGTCVVATWEASPDQLFAHLVAAARAAFPDSEIHSIPAEHGIQFWCRVSEHSPMHTGFQLGQRWSPAGSRLTDLVALPLRTAGGGTDLPLRFPPHKRLVAELERLSGARAMPVPPSFIPSSPYATSRLSSRFLS